MTSPNEVKKPAEPNLLENLWSFNYKRGSAPMTAVVRARTEEIAFMVATRWCEMHQYRTPAGIKPMIVAGEEILDQAAPADRLAV